MFKRNLIAAAIVLAYTGPALAQDAELAKIREEIRQMKDTYEKRIQTLEKRLSDAEAKAGKAETAAGKAEQNAARAETAVVQAASRQASENAFNPAISLIPQGTYGNFSKNPDTFRIGGFIPPNREREEIEPGRRGFRLGESELTITANIDPYFRGSFTAAVTPDNSIEVEEAYASSTMLGHGLTVKAGRFFSGIGYLNEVHQHAWDFVDAPLAYQALLGTGSKGNFSDDGVQLKWVAPTNLFLEIGAEAGRGLSFPGSDRNKNGIGSGTVFAHVGDDIGTSYAWRAGLSYLRTSPQGRPFEDVDSGGTSVTNSFTGLSRLWIADFLLKWAPQGNAAYTNFKLQGEYLRRNESGTLTFDANGATGAALAGNYSSLQSGWYLQGVYQFLPRWRAGLRYDRLNSRTPNIGQVASGALSAADFPLLAANDPQRYTVMFDYNPSEFSRFRLQWARDQSRPGRVTDNQFFIQYIYSLGAHGAHKF